MAKKKIFIITGVILLAGAAYFIFDRKESQQAPAENLAISQPQEQATSSVSVNTDLPVATTSEAKKPAEPVINNPNLKKMKIATIKTNLGEIQFETFDADAPKTVENFITLANKGFYNGVIFHRVIDGFMIQGGDPNCTPSTGSGPCGAGGPGYKFADELNPATASYKAGYKKGVVAMANSGPNTNGSQFFIMVADLPLPHNYTIFGKVIKGQEVADAISKVPRDGNDKPLSPVTMEKVIISEVNNQ